MTQPFDAGTPPWGSPEPAPPVTPVPRPDQAFRLDELRCPVCSGTAFSEEEGRMQTRWGMGSHVFTIRICERCGHALLFYQGGGMAM